MIVSTFTIQNDFKKYKKTKSYEIYQYLTKNNIDILGLQEVFYMCNYDLKKLIKHSFFMKGKYRFFLKIIHLTSNEKTPIISKHKVVSHKTYHLPYRPSPLKRVLTNMVIDYNGKLISVYNTHLESELDSVKQKQLNMILDIIYNDNLPKIIMGDFNLKNDHPLLKNFIDKLNSLNIKRVPVEENTFKMAKSNKAIDHIFIGDEFEINSFEVIKTISISDHYPILVNLKIKK